MQRDGVTHQRTLALEAFIATWTGERWILAAFVALVLIQTRLRVIRALTYVAPEYSRLASSPGMQCVPRVFGFTVSESGRERRRVAITACRTFVHSVSRAIESLLRQFLLLL